MRSVVKFPDGPAVATAAADAFLKEVACLLEAKDEIHVSITGGTLGILILAKSAEHHLYEMDYLKEGIGLRAMAQRDPLVEYQREGFGMFQQMMGAIREEVIGYMFNLEVSVQGTQDHAEIQAPGLEAHVDNRAQLTYVSPDEDGSAHVSGAGEDETPNNGAGSSFFKN